MNQNLLKIGEAMFNAFNQEWIINIRARIFEACEQLIPLFEN